MANLIMNNKKSRGRGMRGASQTGRYKAKTNQLRRILNFLSMESTHITGISKGCGMVGSITKDGLLFLIGIGLVEKCKPPHGISNCTHFYRLVKTKNHKT